MAYLAGPVFQAHLPFSWQTGDVTQAASEWEILRYLPILADFEQNQNASDLAQAKQDLTLLWLARQQDVSLPPCQPIELGMGEVSWRSDVALSAGQTGFVSLALSQSFPLLLTFSARIVNDCAANETAVAQLTNLSSALSDAWEKTVFRYHRRAIQQAKQQ